jgi:hypothetical protein
MKRPPIFGLLAEFETPTELVTAARTAYNLGYRKMDAYSPFPIEELSEAVGYGSSRMPLVVLVGGLIGLSTALLLQYWISVLSYPINVGGRPLASWPAFIVVAFELTVLGAAIFGVFGMLAINGLPMPYHPVFNVKRFAFATKDRFFLCIEATDPQFHRENTQRFLESLNPREIAEVPH